MNSSVLQKSAKKSADTSLPKEILNPLQASQHYSVQILQPSQELAYFVDHFWILRWDMPEGEMFTSEVIPSPYTNLTFMKEGARITGVTTGKYTYDVKGKGIIIGVKFHPGGFYPFFKQSLSKITDTFIPASSVFPEIDESFNASMLELTDDKQIISELEKFLLSKKPKQDENISRLGNIITFVTENNDHTVGEIASKFGMSERSIQELFHDYVGVGLKWIILRARLIKAAEIAVKLENPDWARIATDLGYSDQSHFVNDFKRIIGMPPAQYAAKTRS